MITLTQLEYIVAVERLGSFHKAAKACHVTQPTLSMQVKKLEEDLGVLIFDRSEQPIITTVIGKKLISQARVVLAQTEILNVLIQDEKTLVTGNLRLAVIPTIAPYLLPLFLPEFHRSFPAVELVVQELTTNEIIQALKANQLDVGFLATPLHEPDLIEFPLYQEELYVYAPEDDPVASLDFVSNKDLAEESLLLLSDGHCLRDQMLALCRRSRKSLSKLGNMQFQSGSLATLCRLVEQGYGYTILPSLATTTEARLGAKVLRFQEPHPMREVGLIVHKSFAREKMRLALGSVVERVLPKAMRGQEGRIIPVRSV